MKQSKRLSEVHELALEQFGRLYESTREERKQCLEDRRFCTIAGAQWEGDLEAQYENRPRFEVNKVHLSVIRIINEYRNNRITVDYTPRDNGSDELADLCDSMYRADEQDSEAQEAYDNAYEEGVQGGMGAWRLRAEYEDEYDDENDRQRIKFEPIYDADITVFFDLDAKRQDKSDAKYCFVVSSMTPEAYMEEWDDDPTTWPTDIYDDRFDWNRPDIVYVAEYYAVEEKYETKVYYTTVLGEEEAHWLHDITEEKEAEFASLGHEEVRRRKIKRRKIHKYIMSGGGILEDSGYIAGKEIPIIPCYGKRWFVENIERCMGHVRLAKDPQRLKNLQLSKLGEISALSSTEKPIVTPEQMAGHQKMWAEDNIKNYPYLLINPLTNEEGQTVAQGPIAYTKPSSVPPALAALLQLTEEDMKEILGSQEKGEEMMSHISGKAVELVQTRLDMQTYIYMSNFAKAMRRCGEVWLSMAKDIYIEDEREVKVLSKDNKSGSEMINITKPNENGEIVIANNLEDAHMDVVATVGPSSHSQREAIVRQITGMIQYAQDPMDQQVLSAMGMMNMDGEGSGEMREYFRKKLVKFGVLDPTEEDMAMMQPEEPSPNDQYLLAEAQKAQVEAQKAEAEVVETLANAELKRAQAAQIQAELMKEEPAPQGPEKDEYREGEIMLQAQKAAKELELKEREIELKEQEMALKEQEQTAKLAEIGAKMIGEENQAANAAQGHEAAMEMAQQVANAVKGLQGATDKQNEDREKAMEELNKPRKVVRDENGDITGIE